jgi:antitoxin CptB
MVSDADFNRLCWHSRRGMLELDLVLEPFVKQQFRQLSELNQQRYEQLLECEDQDLFSWFLGRIRPQDEEIASIVDTILEYKTGSTRT